MSLNPDFRDALLCFNAERVEYLLERTAGRPQDLADVARLEAQRPPG